MLTGIQVSSLRPLLKTPGQVSEAFSRFAQMGCTTVALQETWSKDPFDCMDEALSWLNEQLTKKSPRW